MTLQLHAFFLKQGNCVAVFVTIKECRTRPQVREELCSEVQWAWGLVVQLHKLCTNVVLPLPPKKEELHTSRSGFVAFTLWCKHRFHDPVFVLVFCFLLYQCIGYSKSQQLLWSSRTKYDKIRKLNRNQRKIGAKVKMLLQVANI